MSYDASRFREYFEHAFSYAAGFRRNVSRYGAQLAILDPETDRSWTYRELDGDVARAASALAELGVGRGDRVVYQLTNCPEFAILYLATQRLGAVGVPINFRLAPGETAHILSDSEPAVFVYGASGELGALQAVKISGLSPVLLAVSPGDDGGTPTDGGTRSLAAALAAAPERALSVPEDFSIYEETTRLYTSGTTGMPKGVPLPSLVEVMSAHDVIMHFPLTPYDRTLNMTPWFHRGGLYSGGPNPVFYVGGSVVPLRAFNAARVLDWVEKYGITFLIGAPVTLGMLADEQVRSPRDLSGLRGIVTMGAPLSRGAALRYQQVLTPRIFNGYGTTEAFWNTFLRPEDLPAHAGTAGRACTDDDVAVVRIYPDRAANPDEFAARDGQEVGEIIMRSPKSGFSYFNLPQKDEEKFQHGWLYPGDLASWDEDGFVTIVGRKDDMIISGGENIHPVQVEEVLGEHPGVSDAVVVGLPDPHWGQKVVAYVMTHGDVTVDELDRHCFEHPLLSNFKRPRAYRFVQELPLTATGKKMHFKVAGQAVADGAAGLLLSPSTGGRHDDGAAE
ncbi:class I adenylate-forming enzyme family protein [Arthrobacter sp. H14-L1]|uniref:class I adenylate-forming enzyme family protein n=1 Tax=Arthrobacter sp. H14-L1 TaxID=2996697 RepID=UPI002270BCAF|nr:AMP-binding protein [Arthrobacter sp. H14-L1]MCY0903972.1 AMP-binding protein [Arthrobacter sp. H14-L1]